MDASYALSLTTNRFYTSINGDLFFVPWVWSSRQHRREYSALFLGYVVCRLVVDDFSDTMPQPDYTVELTRHALISSPNPLGYSTMTFTSPDMAMGRSTTTSRAINPTPATEGGSARPLKRSANERQSELFSLSSARSTQRE